MNISESSFHRTFPTEGLPSPRVDNALCPSESPIVSSDPAAAWPSLTEINRWFCCRCARSGYRDPVGIGINPPPLYIPSSTNRAFSNSRSFNNSDHIRERERERAREPERENENDDYYYLSSSGRFELSFHDQDLFPFTMAATATTTIAERIRRPGHGMSTTTSPTSLICPTSPTSPTISTIITVADTPSPASMSTSTRKSRHSAPPQPGITTTTNTAAAHAPEHGGVAMCFRTECGHSRCHNCLLGPSHDIARASRTVGGLHTSPAFLDPIYWVCACGEWARNTLVGAATAWGAMCANPGGCPGRWRGLGGGLVGGSLVLNRFGQRLGTADQRVAVRWGPWWWQRRGLGREECVLIGEFRRGGDGGGGGLRGDEREGEGNGVMLGRRHNPTAPLSPPLAPPPPTPAAGEYRIWREGEPCPRYPIRRPPRGGGGVMPGSGALGEYDAEYEREYLRGILTVPPPPAGDPGSSSSSTLSAGERGYRTDLRHKEGGGGGFFHGWGNLRM